MPWRRTNRLLETRWQHERRVLQAVREGKEVTEADLRKALRLPARRVPLAIWTEAPGVVLARLRRKART